MSESPREESAAPEADEAKTPDEIRAEIEQTQQELGDTVEALAAKTDVKAQAQDRIATAKHQVTENVAAAKDTVTQRKDDFVAKAKQATPESASAGAEQLQSTVKDKPLPFATAGAFFAGLVVGWLIGRR